MDTPHFVFPSITTSFPGYAPAVAPHAVVRFTLEDKSHKPIGSVEIVFGAPGRIREVRLFDAAGLTPTDAKRFPWHTYMTEADAVLRAEPGQRGMSRSMAKALKIDLGTGRPGRRGHPKKHYEKIAKRYEQLRLSGERHPAKKIAEELNVSGSTARGLIAKCRELNLLPEARPGKAG